MSSSHTVKKLVHRVNEITVLAALNVYAHTICAYSRSRPFSAWRDGFFSISLVLYLCYSTDFRGIKQKTNTRRVNKRLPNRVCINIYIYVYVCIARCFSSETESNWMFRFYWNDHHTLSIFCRFIRWSAKCYSFFLQNISIYAYVYVSVSVAIKFYIEMAQPLVGASDSLYVLFFHLIFCSVFLWRLFFRIVSVAQLHVAVLV